MWTRRLGHARKLGSDVPYALRNQKLEGLTFDLDDDEIIGCPLVDCRIMRQAAPLQSNRQYTR